MLYAGSPNECEYHWVWLSKVVVPDDNGDCPLQKEHTLAGPAAG